MNTRGDFRIAARRRPSRMGGYALPRGRVGPIASLQRAFRARKKVAPALRTRVGSSTMLMRKRKPAARQLVRGSSSGITTKSQFSLYHRPTTQALLQKRIGAPNVYTGQLVGKTFASFGFQGIGCLSHHDIAALKLYADNLGLNGAAVGTGSKRYLLESYQQELMLTNSTNVTCEVEIYDIVLRRDVLITNTAYLGGAIADYYPWAASPCEAWKLGSAINNGVLPAGAAPYETFLGSSPFDSQQFRDYFKVIKRTNVHLPIGASHTHWVFSKANRVIDQSLFNDNSTAGKSGLTFYTMWVAKGYPVNDNSEGGVTTTGEVQLNWVRSLRTKYTRISDYSNSVMNTDSLTSPAEASTEVYNTANGFIELVKSLNTGTP